MTSFLDSATVSGIRSSMSGLFWDECVILRRTAPASESGYGREDEQWGDYDDAHPELEVTTSCKVSVAEVSELADWTQRPQARAAILFPAPIEGHISELDRVKITKRFGTALARELVCDVAGNPVVGVTGVIAQVRLRPEGAGNG